MHAIKIHALMVRHVQLLAQEILIRVPAYQDILELIVKIVNHLLLFHYYIHKFII